MKESYLLLPLCSSDIQDLSELAKFVMAFSVGWGLIFVQRTGVNVQSFLDLAHELICEGYKIQHITLT